MTAGSGQRQRSRTAFFVLGPLLGWLLLECLAALTLLALPDRELPKDDPEWLISAKEAWNHGFFQPDEHTIWRPRPGYREPAGEAKRYGTVDLAIDDHGHRVVPNSRQKPTTKPEGVRRVLLVGGSHPFGMWVNPSESYVEVLGDMLNAKEGGTWEVMNAACPGHTTFQGRKYIEEHALAFEPDIVLFDLGMNDTLPLSLSYASPDHQVQAVPTWASRLSGTLTSLPSYRLLKNGLASIVGQARPSEVRVPFDRQLENQSAVRKLGESAGFKTLFFSQVSAASPEAGGEAKCKYVPEGFEPYVDICGPFELLGSRAGYYFHDPIHANAQGHAIIGRTVFDRLEELGWTN